MKEIRLNFAACDIFLCCSVLQTTFTAVGILPFSRNFWNAYLLCNAFKCYTMEYPTSHLNFFVVHGSFKYAKKIKLGIIHDIPWERESCINKQLLNEAEKNMKNSADQGGWRWVHRGQRPRWITPSEICRRLDNTLRDLQNYSYPMKGEFNNCFIMVFIQNISPFLKKFRYFALCFSAHQN